MENMKRPVLRKLRKIKRPKTAPRPMAFGVPEKAIVPEPPREINSRIVRPAQQQTSVPQTNVAQPSFASKETFYNKNAGMESVRFANTDNQISEAAYDSQSATSAMKNKSVLMSIILAALAGMYIGATFFSAQDTSKHGLEGVVANPDVPAGRSRCGLVDNRQGCVLYIMNPKSQNVSGKDFYSAAAQWTKREKYQIEVGNIHYGNKVVKPGQIAQIYIPPL